ncbi:tetratricopeptide repeat-containing sensor histidine kinase [Clostridium sp.]|uniref:ATP-binding protein n=1 Tax=Clostridium sp. TaxID=1506 RepID=UPI0025BF665D|nr:tetratricopeptide repeat-containing sensor histidine kinase [Clostridium sp.]
MYTEALKKRESQYIEKYLNKTREMISSLKEEETFNIYVCLGEVYFSMKDYNSAKDMFIQAIKYAKIKNKYDEIAFGVCYLKDIFTIDNRLDEAKEIIVKTIEEYKNNLSIMTKLTLVIEILEIYLNEKELGEDVQNLIKYLNKNIEKLDKFKQQQFRIKINIQICRKIILELRAGVSGREKVVLIKDLISESEENYNKYNNNFKFTNTDYWIKIIRGDICIFEGNYQDALEYYNDALRISYRFNVKYTLRSYDGIKAAYKKSGDYEKALMITKRMNSILKDINIENEKKVTKINNRYNDLKSYDKIKEQFFSRLSYDLKEPINSIYSSVQLIDTMSNIGISELKEYYLKYETVIIKNCLKVLKTINNLIDAVKIDAHEFKVDFKNYNIVYLIEDIISRSVKYANIKNQNLIFDTEIEELIIKCDPNLIEKIILSILSNICMVSFEESDILIRVLERKNYINIVFKYRGNSFNNSTFNVFKNDTKSCPLNTYAKDLSIAKSLLELQNGKVYVNNKCDEGDEVVILLPKIKFQYLNKNTTKDTYKTNDINVAMEFCDLII